MTSFKQLTRLQSCELLNAAVCAKTIVKESHNFELANLKEEKAKEEKEEEEEEEEEEVKEAKDEEEEEEEEEEES